MILKEAVGVYFPSIHYLTTYKVDKVTRENEFRSEFEMSNHRLCNISGNNKIAYYQTVIFAGSGFPTAPS